MPKAESPFVGNWHIVSMTEWDEDYLNEEVQAFVDFDALGDGEFQFGPVSGGIDYRVSRRDGKPTIEFSCEGNDGTENRSGRGWAVAEGDELQGMMFIHCGDDSGFVARRA